MHNYLVVIDIKSDWHIGSGKEAGAYADALVLKDNQFLPYIPGKSIKGLLRDAFQTAEDAGWFGKDAKFVDVLFGKENSSGNLSQGLIQVSSARLSDQEVQYLVEENATKHLFRVIQSTAIDGETGTAKHSSLRSIEVAVPMRLTSQINLNTAHPLYVTSVEIQEQFGDWLTHVVTLISELGGKRHRGLGQVTLSVEEA
jgi:CRISPR/Cas system CSM-associated protein Csm3 (group 7 of RAMP superfamily)